jgi:hypothetical protein
VRFVFHLALEILMAAGRNFSCGVNLLGFEHWPTEYCAKNKVRIYVAGVFRYNPAVFFRWPLRGQFLSGMGVSPIFYL